MSKVASLAEQVHATEALRCWLTVPRVPRVALPRCGAQLLVRGSCGRGQDGAVLPPCKRGFTAALSERCGLRRDRRFVSTLPLLPGFLGRQRAALSRCLSSLPAGLAHGGIQNLSFKKSAHDFVRSFS